MRKMFDEISLNCLIRSGANVWPWQSRVPCAPSFLYFPQALLHCCGLLVSSPGLCFAPGRRLPEALFMVSRLDSKVVKACKY